MTTQAQRPTRVNYEVRPLLRKDFAAVTRLQRKGGALYAPWTTGQLESHMRNFPDGQWVALDADGALVGLASTLRVALASDELPGDWTLVTGNGYFHTHAPDGNVLYLVDLSIDPDADRAAVRQALDEAMVAFSRQEGVERLLTACRLPGFDAHAGKMTPEAYVRGVTTGRLREAVVAGLVKNGFRPVGLLPDMQNGPRTAAKLAMLLEWQAPAA